MADAYHCSVFVNCMTLQPVVGLCSMSWVLCAAGCGKLCTKAYVAAAMLAPSALSHHLRQFVFAFSLYLCMLELGAKICRLHSSI
jgi:hypothetical protein